MAKIEARGLHANPSVDRRGLIRRAYFDLIGLPPTPEEVEAFLADSTADAYEQLIDRLLRNPRYGERWGRHWLDLARFAESHGYEQDYDRPHAYHYRDFVIRALNLDIPYDQFVKWQIAGDEFAPDNPLALMATGFLAAGTHATQITANQAEKERYDELDDMARTIGTSMLGLTIGCARCHDHKYDPITMVDYYRLISTFSTTVRSEFDVNMDPAGYKEAVAKYDEEHAPLANALRKFEQEQLPVRFGEWLKTRPTAADLPRWIILDPVEYKSQGGVNFTKLDDASLLVSGANPDQDTYTIVVNTPPTKITAIRLEALAHGSFVKGGPGRAENGNFGLTDLRVTAAPLAGTVEAVPVELRNARASFEQKGLPVGHAIDDKADTCWAVDPEFGKDHAAVFDTAQGIGFEGSAKLTFTLEFKCNKKHAIGRPRISIATVAPVPAWNEAGIPEPVLTSIEKLNEGGVPDLSDSERDRVLHWYRTIDSEWTRLQGRVQDHAKSAPKPKLAKVLISSEGVPAVRLHTQGLDFYDPTYFLRRGDPNQKAEVMTQGFPSVLTRAPDGEAHWREAPPSGSHTSYRRRALANWLTDVDHGAGHLLARVIVNRLWYYHMGQGIVATPSDFGKQGSRPSHPELLDWMARELIVHGWSLKSMHKLIMTSAVYMQSNAADEARLLADRDNSLYWHRPGRRLEAEVIRDAMLLVSGSLDDTMYGPGTLDPKHRRRSIYFFVKRSQLVPMMTLFDGPDTLQDLPCRVSTTIAPQALMLLNNAAVREHASGLARRIQVSATDRTDMVRSAFLITLSRPPTAEELSESIEFLETQLSAYNRDSQEKASELAFVDFCQALLCLNEFVYVE